MYFIFYNVDIKAYEVPHIPNLYQKIIHVEKENYMSKRPIIIDTDPGIDDALAIAIALFSEELDVKLITTVAGNVSLDQVTENALKLLKFYEKDVPVAKGCAQRFWRSLWMLRISMEKVEWRDMIFRSRKQSFYYRNMP